MNILVLTNIYPYENEKKQNRTSVVAFFAREWAHMGHHVYVIVDSSNFPSIYYTLGKALSKYVFRHFFMEPPERIWAKPFSYRDGLVTVNNLPMRKWMPGGRFSDRAIKRQVDSISSLLKRSGFIPDVITGHWQNPQLAIVSGLKTLYTAQTAFVFHGDYSKELCAKHHANEYLPNIDHIGCRSLSAAKEIKENLRLHEEPFVCASGVPDSFVEKYAASGQEHKFENSLSILSAGRLVASKSIDAVIKASARALPAGTYSLLIAGEGPLKDEYQIYVRDHNLDNVVSFLGRIPREALQERMRDSDIFVLISRGETFGLVHLEAMLHGCIVVAPRYGGVDGILVDGENGFLCNAGDEEELVSVLSHIANLSLDEKRRVSRNAVETVKNYTDSKVAARYLTQIIA